MADPLITLLEYKSLMGIQAADTRNDAHISALLGAASKAVRSYAGRSFEVAGGPLGDRSFQYDESGFLDIDDATAVTSLSSDVGLPGQSYPLTVDEWTQMPQDDSEVFYYVVIHGGPYFSASREMGFERNLDTIGMRAKSPLISVTATWGWPAIPDDVRLATALTISELVSGGPGGKQENLTSEAIEGWQRSWGNKQGSVTAALAVPNRARDLLSNYQRIYV